MAITKEQWAEIEEQLSTMFGCVELLCDGYRVSAQIKTIAKFKQGIVVYVDGQILGAWFDGKCDEPKKFHREVKRYLYSARDRERAKTQLKKRGTSEILREFWKGQATSSFTQWLPWWTNAKAFRRHISKTCTEIEVVKIGYGGGA